MSMFERKRTTRIRYEDTGFSVKKTPMWVFYLGAVFIFLVGAIGLLGAFPEIAGNFLRMAQIIP